MGRRYDESDLVSLTDESGISLNPLPFILKNDGTDDDIKSIEIGFNNSESVFIDRAFIMDYYFELTTFVDIIDDPIFKQALRFKDAHLILDLPHLQQVFGDNVLEKFILKNGINNIKVEYNNNYPHSQDIGMMLLIPIYKESGLRDDNSIVISWKDIKVK